MRSFNYLFVIGNVVAASYLAVIQGTDGENNCRVWSQSNHGCTGYSATFAKLKGKDCSSFIGADSDEKSVKVDICGTENGEQVAWVTVNKNGTVAFLNREGDTSSCMLENGLQVPSSQSSFSTAIGRSASKTAHVDQTSTPIFTWTPANSQSLASTSASNPATETPLADQSPTLASTPACTCSCKSAVV
ncbi:hypothetical protein PENANT_c080G09169 [Penicillium antarcticum]|uniref:Secreted protein n=1 Tax=Penicillium antarcticum TaxID=416450 RepID=A0A1V6PQF4_9EURO|nr:hypothetical protein PENANT_c080G09169 [Penicillium antarcticum]